VVCVIHFILRGIDAIMPLRRLCRNGRPAVWGTGFMRRLKSVPGISIIAKTVSNGLESAISTACGVSGADCAIYAGTAQTHHESEYQR
jgi:hypothetical protein